MPAYYNEFDPFAAQWLKNLVSAGLVAPGDVDDRDMRDVKPDDLRGYEQAHFCAGIGIWSHALRSSGWGDARPVWTGSFPCQPFSAAGKGAGFADERDIWPFAYHLVGECRPDVILGEQVSSPDGLHWLSRLSADMEAAGYAIGALDTCAAGFVSEQGEEGFHLRQRLYWGARRLGDANDAGPQGRLLRGHGRDQRPAGQGSVVGGVGHPESDGRQRRSDDGDSRRWERTPGQAGAADRLANADDSGRQPRRGDDSGARHRAPSAADRVAGAGLGNASVARAGRHAGASAGEESGLGVRAERDTSGAPSSVDWLPCRDGFYRPVEGGTFPLAHEDPQRVGQLRAYGNALDAAQAKGFITAWMECCP